MINQPKFKPATLRECELYTLTGEAVCTFQILEDCLSTLITLKKNVVKPNAIPKHVANQFREKYQSYTLGQIINLIKNDNLLSDFLQQSLENLLPERNWLIHKSIRNENEACTEANKRKIKSICNMAHIVLKAAETDLMQYSSSVGINMHEVYAAIEMD